MILAPFYIIIVLQILLVQIINSANWYTFGHYSPLIGLPQQNAFSQSKVNVRNPVSNKDEVYNNALLIEDLYNRNLITPYAGAYMRDTSLDEIKMLLNILINKVDSLRKSHKRDTSSKKLRISSKKNKRRENRRKRWGRWTDWSACSVSCGKGREIQWRHCLHNCNGVETEMKEKSCQLPACGGKLFGIIKL